MTGGRGVNAPLPDIVWEEQELSKRGRTDGISFGPTGAFPQRFEAPTCKVKGSAHDRKSAPRRAFLFPFQRGLLQRCRERTDTRSLGRQGIPVARRRPAFGCRRSDLQ